jgi:hypothetical protein
MSTKTTFRGHRLAAVPLVLTFAGFAVPADGPSPAEPVPTYQTSLVPNDWPDEGRGYPGYTDPPKTTVATRGTSLEPTSVAAGALAGIALSATGLGLGLAVQRRRDHTSPSTL